MSGNIEFSQRYVSGGGGGNLLVAGLNDEYFLNQFNLECLQLQKSFPRVASSNKTDTKTRSHVTRKRISDLFCCQEYFPMKSQIFFERTEKKKKKITLTVYS